MLRMKKNLALALACALALSLTACGKPSSSPSGSSTPPADSGTQTSAPGRRPGAGRV